MKLLLIISLLFSTNLIAQSRIYNKKYSDELLNITFDYIEKNELKKADSIINLAISYDKKFNRRDCLKFHNRGCIKMKFNDYKSAQMDFDTALIEYPTFYPSIKQRVKCKLINGDSLSVIKDLKLCLEIAPKDIEAYQLSIVSNIKLNLFKDVYRLCDEAILVNDESRYYFFKVLTYYKENKTVEYLENEYLKALKKFGDNDENVQLIQIYLFAYKHDGNFCNAIQKYEKTHGKYIGYSDFIYYDFNEEYNKIYKECTTSSLKSKTAKPRSAGFVTLRSNEVNPAAQS